MEYTTKAYIRRNTTISLLLYLFQSLKADVRLLEMFDTYQHFDFNTHCISILLKSILRCVVYKIQRCNIIICTY